MKHAIVTSVSVLALALAGCGKKEEPVVQDPAAAEASMAASGDAAAAAVTPAQAFADAAAASDAFEIQVSQLAAEKGASAKSKKFAEHMIKAHTESTAKLKTAAAGAMPAITPNPALTAQQQQTLDDLRSKTGAAFDTAFAEAQVDGHQKTLDTLKAYSATGGDPALKAFATDLVPIVTAHLNMAKAL